VSDFFRGRRVLVTGHTGFKGSWLSLWLAERGAQVTGFSLAPPTSPSLFVQANVAARLDSIEGDVRDLAALERAFSRANPEIVLHLAAQPLVRASYADPVETYSTNVMGTVHVLECVRKSKGVLATVVVTSDKCYENREWIWGYRECDALGGHDPYSSSKGCAEIVASAYSRSFFGSSRLATARAGNVIGGGDWAADRLLPDLARAAASGVPARIRSPRSVRPWQHVIEALHGYLLLAERLVNEPERFATPYNFGPPAADMRSVGEVLELWSKHWPGESHWVLDAADHVHEARLLALDSTKAQRELSWHPRLGTETAVRWTADWYRAVAAGADPYALCVEQIQSFVSGNAS
jgi:CDP-glucose 4,6-dehydratase